MSSGTKKLLSMIMATGIAIGFIHTIYTGKKSNFEDAANFGAATAGVMAKVEGYPIHCNDMRDAADCLAGVRARHAQNTVLWLGNSQVHAVNQLHEGETNAPPLIFNALKSNDLDLVTFSQPNANLQEHYLLFEYLQHRLPLKVLILPAVFDDMREDGLRKEIAETLADANTKTALEKTAIGQKIILKAESSKAMVDQDTAGLANTLQQKVERVLNAGLEKHSQLWAARPEARGRMLGSLYVLRNTVLGIKPTSKRKMIRSRYQDNIAAMEAILASVTLKHLAVVIYIVPLRNDVDTPYVDGEYQQFKNEVQRLAERYDATFANLENLVPAHLWCSKAATSAGGGMELDFMHFQAGGHQLLADQLTGLVKLAWAHRINKP